MGNNSDALKYFDDSMDASSMQHLMFLILNDSNNKPNTWKTKFTLGFKVLESIKKKGPGFVDDQYLIRFAAKVAFLSTHTHGNLQASL